MDWQRHKHRWPNAAHSSFVRAARHEWHVQSMGDGPTTLLLHGAGASTHTWADIFSTLGETGRVIAIDLPGQGFTRLGDRKRCGLDPMTEDISALLTALDVTPDLIIGHSAGAAIALNLAPTLTPQPHIISINGAVENFSGVPGVLFPMVAKLLSLNPATAHFFSFFSANEARVKRLIASTGSTLTPRQLSYYQALVSDVSHVNATLSMMAQWSLEDLPERLSKITSPVLFLTGARDGAVPPEASHRAAKLIAHATVETMPMLGHLMHEEDANAVIARIRAAQPVMEQT